MYRSYWKDKDFEVIQQDDKLDSGSIRQMVLRARVAMEMHAIKVVRRLASSTGIAGSSGCVLQMFLCRVESCLEL